MWMDVKSRLIWIYTRDWCRRRRIGKKKVRVSSGGALPERHFLAKPTVAARTTASAHLRPPPRQTGDPQGTPASRWGTTANPSAASAYGLPSFSSPQHRTKCAQPRITYRGTHRGHEPEHALSADDELSQVDSLERRPALDRTRDGRGHGLGRQVVATLSGCEAAGAGGRWGFGCPPSCMVR